MFCIHCGSKIEDGANFCTSCGCSQNNNGNNASAGSQPFGSGMNNGNYNGFGGANQGNSNGFNNGNNGGYKVPIPKRNIVLCIVLSIVTCGIYQIYWMVKMVDELNYASGRISETGGITVILLGIVTCGIYWLYWYYKAGEKINEVKNRRGVPGDRNTSILFLILTLFGFSIVNICLIQDELNKVAAL